MAKEQLFQSYLSSAVFLVQEYAGKTPFSFFLKEYFSANKKYGSRDRKYITQLCYSYFRTGHSLKETTPEKRMLYSLFLCSAEKNELLQNLAPEWTEKVALPLEEKIALLHSEFTVQEIFPWANQLSQDIEVFAFCISHLIQPFLFLRIRPRYREKVFSKLLVNQIPFEEPYKDGISFNNATKLDEVLAINKEVVVQDLNSQRVGEFFSKIEWKKTSNSVWDCCAASGGKSMMLVDAKSDIKLTVSDIRENILANLKKRFATAGITNYKSFIADLSKTSSKQTSASYQLIIADVPCSGSGTWSRTPEQLYFFEEKKIEEYAALQKSILKNAVTALEPEGYLLYITCSVFKKENEDAVEFLKEKFQLQVVKMDLLKGYDKKADTLFAALLRK